MATAHVIIEAAVTEQSKQAAIAEAKAKAASALRDYEGQLVGHHVTDDVRKDGESGRLCSGGGWDWVKNAYREYQRAEQQVRAVEDIQRNTQCHGERIRIAVTDSYSIKDDLKAHGYRFSSAGHWLDMLGMRTAPAWVRTMPLEHGEGEAELTRLHQMGVTLSGDPLASIMHPANLLTQPRK